MPHPNAPELNKVADYQRPLQTIPWSEKNEEWFRKNVNHLIQKANFSFGTEPGNRKDLSVLYNVYNNQFPLEWFKHFTNPLSAKKKEHKNFPAKIRPVTILRTNIDLLLGEYPRRPFIYNVSNLGESGYNRYMEKMNQAAQSTLTDHFMRAALEQMQAEGEQLTPQQLQKLQQDPPVPAQVKAEFMSSYKDEIAIKAQKYLRRQIQEEEIRTKQHDMFKDWLIAGAAYSYKGIENESMVYRRISPLCIDYDKSHSSSYIEDGEWVVYKDMLVLSDIIDRFYMMLKEKNVKDLESNVNYSSAGRLYDFLKSSISGFDHHTKIPVYHCQWKGRKKIGFLSYLDMETFKYVEEVVDENYVVNRERGEQVEWRWVNEVYEGWRITDNETDGGIFCGLQACPVQRNEMNNLSACKLSYNGRKYSDTHSENLSVLEIGIPFQIMTILITYTLEKTIAKSKGKILLIDKNAIPDDDDWDEEKFFYYGEGMGYALIDRSQPGVDKTWNQYQVVDMSLFDQIKQLIEMLDYFKQQWDDVIGITRQRKGQTYASDGQGVNERSVFQSTVITDMIFLGFEQFVQKELQGIMDLSKFTTSKGVYSLYNDDEYGTILLDILPEDFQTEELGVFVVDAAEELRKLNEMKQYVQALVQNEGAKGSTVLEIIDSVNIAELKQKLKEFEAIEAEIERQTQQSQFDADAAADERLMKMKQYEELLKRETMHEEYAEKQEIEMIKGTFNTFTFQNGDSNANGVPDATEVQKILQGQVKIMADIDAKGKDRQVKIEKLRLEREQLQHQMEMDRENLKVAHKKLKIDAKKAAQRPKATAKK